MFLTEQALNFLWLKSWILSRGGWIIHLSCWFDAVAQRQNHDDPGSDQHQHHPPDRLPQVLKGELGTVADDVPTKGRKHIPITCCGTETTGGGCSGGERDRKREREREEREKLTERKRREHEDADQTQKKERGCTKQRKGERKREREKREKRLNFHCPTTTQSRHSQRDQHRSVLRCESEDHLCELRIQRSKGSCVYSVLTRSILPRREWWRCWRATPASRSRALAVPGCPGCNRRRPRPPREIC